MEERHEKLRTTMDSLPTQYPSYILGRRRELGASSEAGNGQATGQVFSASQDRGDITRKYMEELMKIRAILVRFVHINYFGVDNSLTSTLTLLSGGRRGTSL